VRGKKGASLEAVVEKNMGKDGSKKKKAQPEEEPEEDASSSDEEESSSGEEASEESSSEESGEEGEEEEEEGEAASGSDEEEEEEAADEEGEEEAADEEDGQEEAAGDDEEDGGQQEESSDEEEDDDDGKQVADDAMDDAEQARLKEIMSEPYTPPLCFEVKVGDKSIRAVAVPRARMGFENVPKANCVIKNDEDDDEDYVTLFPPGDLTWAAGAEKGAAAGLGAAHNALTKDYRRLMLIGLKRTGTMMSPPWIILKWMRKTQRGLGEAAIRKVEKAIADPANYDECVMARMKTIGPPPTRRPSKKRAAKDSPDADEQESPPKRSRNDDGLGSDLMLFLAVFGEGIAHAARNMMNERSGGAINGHADE
jgi:hypothetical protein